MAHDAISWQDVALALAGAPIGALITVAGIGLTNRSNRASQERQLEAQLELQRQSLEHDLKGEHQRRVLSVRADLYAEIIEVCEAIDAFSEWIVASEQDGAIREPDDDEFFARVLGPLRKLRGRTAVYCAAEVRHEVGRLSEAVEAFSHDWSRREPLRSAAEQMRECAVEAAIIDRSSGLVPEGMGGM